MGAWACLTKPILVLPGHAQPLVHHRRPHRRLLPPSPPPLPSLGAQALPLGAPALAALVSLLQRPIGVCME